AIIEIAVCKHQTDSESFHGKSFYDSSSSRPRQKKTRAHLRQPLRRRPEDAGRGDEISSAVQQRREPLRNRTPLRTRANEIPHDGFAAWVKFHSTDHMFARRVEGVY